jgi:hypothetical protein
MNNINLEFVVQCENNKINRVKELLDDSNLDITYGNFEAIKLALNYNNLEVIELILKHPEHNKIILNNEHIINEIIGWIKFDSNDKLLKILNSCYDKYPLILDKMKLKIFELKYLDEETIPESKVVVYIPFAFRLLEYFYYWPIINRIIKWFI